MSTAVRAGADALDWLDSQANSDGSYASAADPATPFQSTAETLRAFAALGAGRAGVVAARGFLAADPTRNTEYLARRITAQPEDDDIPVWIAELGARQNPPPPLGDGGFGGIANAPSTVLDTAFALEALAAMDRTAAPELGAALGFLLAHQNGDGGWSDGVNPSSVYLTALVARAMQPFRHRYALDQALDGAVQFLLGRRAADNLIGTLPETALALLVIAPRVFDTTAYQGTVDALRAAQGADGSWDGSVYTTALAVRALVAVAAATPPNPGLATVAGAVTDAVDGMPLGGALVTLGGADNRTTRTAADGSYLIENVTPGAISLRIERLGHLAVTTTETATAGGRVRFSPALPRDPQPRPLTLTGRVINTADNSGLAGATLRVVNGATTALSDSDGRFTLAGLAAGSYQVEIAAANFITRQLSVSAAAGGSLDLGRIALKNNAAGDSGIAATVIDALTRAPLRGVALTFSGPDAGIGYSDADGRFELRPARPGTFTFSASLAGYRIASVTGTLAAGTDLGLHFALVRATHPAEVSVQGRLLDADTAAPLAGVTVSAVAGITRQTGADGRFVLGGLPAGAFTLGFSRSGYVPVAYSVSATAGGSVQLGTVRLAPEAPVSDNRPPDITSTAPAQAAVGRPYVYDVVAGDADGDPLSFGLLGQPPGMAIDAGNGRIRWIPTLAQAGSASFKVVVADDRGGVATQAVSVQVTAGGGSYQIADVQTLGGLAVDALLPQNHSLGSYLSGPPPLASLPGTTVSGAPPCPLGWFEDGNDAAAAAAVPDRRAVWVTADADLIMDLGQGHDTVAVFPQLDQPPVPQRAVGYTVWGSNDAAAPFPDGWTAATLVSLYTRGWETDPACSGQPETDDYAGLYSFGNQAFRYVRLRANFSVTLFDTPAHERWQSQGDAGGEPGWQAAEAKIDAVGGMQCAVKPVADAGQDILGVTGQTMTFDASASRGANLRFAWDVDGDHVIDLTGVRPSLAFSAGFDGDVTLYAIDERGCVATDRLRVTVGLDIPRPDLVIDSIVTRELRTDPFTLQVSGSATVTVGNPGRAAALTAPRVSLFEDRNGNGAFDADSDTLLGAMTLPTGLARDARVTLDLPVSGEVAFRDSPLLVMVDSDLAIDEQREDNNLASTSDICRIASTPLDTLDLVEKWYWPGDPQIPAFPDVYGPVTVAQLTDDNGDGRIDTADRPDVLFIATLAGKGEGRLVAVDGGSGETLWVNASDAVSGHGSPAVGDIDGDGLVEAIIPGVDRMKLYAFEHDGTLKWIADTGPGFTVSGTPRDAVALADLDHDGAVEIIHGRRVFDHLGNQLWEGNGDYGGEPTYGTLPIAVDLDLQGDVEVVAGRTAYRADGSILWWRTDLPSGGGFTAVGNFNDDDYPEIVLVAGGNVYLLDHTGKTLWGPVSLPGGGAGGAPTVGDFDGDGEVEIGIAGARNYIVLETDGRIKWTSPTQDASSHRTGSSLFDFNADGEIEVVYADERFLRVYKGENGEILKEMRLGSGTTLEYPVIADIDGDGRAEIVTGSNGASSSRRGVLAFEAPADDWAPTRAIWNQHSYHITNINDDGSIPRNEQPSWLTHNTYRLNTFADRDPLLSPDLSLSRLRVEAGAGGQPATLTVRIGNAGASATPGPSSVSVYAGDPVTGRLLGSAPVPGLAAGAFVDVTLSDLPALAASDDIVAVVDADNTLIECREDNNRQSVPILLQTRAAGIRVASDATVYPPAAAVQLSARIDNNSLLPGEFRTQLQVEDLNGAVVATFPLRDTGPLDGRAGQTRRETWDSSGFLSGSYRVRGELFSLVGDKLGEATSTFILRHPADQGPAVILSLQPDRAVYFTRDTARITQRISNLSQSTLIEAAQLNLSIADPAGRIIFTSSDPLNTLVPGTLRDRVATQNFENLIPGIYAITAELRAADGGLLASAGGSYRVEADTALALRGTVQVQADTLERGRTQLCTDTLDNLASVNLDALVMRQLLLRLDTAEVVSSDDSPLSLAAGASDSRVRGIATGALAVGVYSCVLQARIAGAWTTLASAPFTLVEPPIDIAAALQPSQALRLLVLLDAPGTCDSDPDADDDRHNDHGHDEDCTPAADSDPRGSASAPSLGARRNVLEDALAAQGWSYRIVTGAGAFTRELRRGGYTTYALFSGRIKLKEQVQKELREAVYRGAGLLVTLNGEARYPALRPVLGARVESRLPAPADLDVEAFEAIAAGSAAFPLAEPARRIDPQGARAVARYPGLSACSDADEHRDKGHERTRREGDATDDRPHRGAGCNAPAVALTHHRYGDGHSLAAGFDLLAQAAQPAADPLFPNLLVEALAATRPVPPLAPLAGGVTAIRLSLINQGIATPGQAVITPPAGSLTLDPGQAAAQADGRLLWPFDLPENDGSALTFWLQLPDAAGSATTEALLQVGIRPDLADYDSLQLTLDLDPRPGLVEVLDTLTALAAQDHAYRRPLKHVQKAKHYLDQGKANKALKTALKAADALIHLDRPRAASVRRRLALAITGIERRL